MALTQDTILPQLEGQYADFPVAASQKIFEGALVGIDASGYAVELVSTNEKFVGVATAQADNSSGANGAIKVKVRRDRHYRQVSLTGALQADVGKTLFASDDGTFTLTASAATPVGRVHAFVSAGVIIALLKPDEQVGAPLANASATYVQAEIIAIQDRLRDLGIIRKT